MPAQVSTKAEGSLLVGVTQAPGGRWIAVGRRGHVLYSDDGSSWNQAEVPVSVDLVAVHFPTKQQGWAVGHGGVILHSADGGQTWQKQLDGRQLAELLIDHWKPLADLATDDDPSACFALQDAKRLKEEGPGRPFLDVQFVNDQIGYAIGAYNLLLETRDAGQHWQVLSDRADNPGSLHLNSIRLMNALPYLVGEQGLLLRNTLSNGRFEPIPTPYEGTWFGLIAHDQFLLLFGLRGNAYASRDQGQSWSNVDTGSDSTITSGASLADGRLALVTLEGELLLSDDTKADRFTSVAIESPAPFYGVAPAGASAVVTVGAKGVRRIDLKPPVNQEKH
ncbi:Ycf48-like protein [compost metagenome]